MLLGWLDLALMLGAVSGLRVGLEDSRGWGEDPRVQPLLDEWTSRMVLGHLWMLLGLYAVRVFLRWRRDRRQS